MQRLRLVDLRNSRLPRSVGLCQDDVPQICDYVNSAQQRLLYAKEAGSESWQGTFAEVSFNLSRATPYITLPREIARLEGATICDHAIPIHNAFVQYLQFGNGRLRTNRRCGSCVLQAVSRNNAVTFVDLTAPPQYIRMYASDPKDVGKRVLLQGTDANGVTIYSTDNLNEVTGIFVALDQPFVTSPLTFSNITGIQKDVTYAPVEFFQVDPTTGAEILLLTMEPGEKTASYRRYYFDNLPSTASSNGVNVTAMAKLELIPVVVDTDFLLIGCAEAVILEAQSIKYSESDSPTAKQMSHDSHMSAIRLLLSELSHYQGVRSPAVSFAPFGSAKLERADVGMI